MSSDGADPTTQIAEDPVPSAESLAPRLCYACHTTLTSRSSRGARRTAGTGGEGLQNVRLPVWVGKNVEAAKDRTRAGMKDQIREFLLDDDEDDA